ncbi:MAG TPA: FtsX-like permease family protein, partial [Terrimicrobiaceae bacterium]|nr:FtsX-like permease family protein [Terrimicrobiaceae bacterium]
PARILHPGSEGLRFSPPRLRRIAGAAALLVSAAAMSILALQGGPKILGFGAAGAVIAGFSLLVPWLAVGVAAGFRGCGPLAKLSSDHLVRSLHRNAVTIAALSAAVAMAISVTVMIHSFRASVQRWIDHTLTADMYIAPAVNEVAGLQAFLPSGAAAWAAGQSGVDGIATFRELSVRFRGEPVSLAVIDGKARGDIAFVGSDPAAAAERFSSGETVAVSESFATRFGLAGPREIRLPTAQGEADFAVSGIYRDFSRDRGTILMPRSLFEKHWADERIHSLALQIGKNGDAGAVAAAFRAKYGAQGEYSIYDNAALRERVFQIFNQTFAVTAALRVIAIFVAVAGVLFALSVLVIEREREIGVLRAIGASRLQVLRVFLGEALIIGLSASLSGVACGAVLAMVLTWVVNKAFFGWTIALSYPFLTLAATPLWLIPAALIAALFPAWKAANVRPARAVRFE